MNRNIFNNAHILAPSCIHLNDEHIVIARELLKTKTPEEYGKVRPSFSIKNTIDFFFGTDYHSRYAEVNWDNVKDAGYMVLFDGEENIIAVISKDEVLYKEDFAKIMKENFIEATEENLNKIWVIGWTQVLRGDSLKEAFKFAIRSANIKKGLVK